MSLIAKVTKMIITALAIALIGVTVLAATPASAQFNDFEVRTPTVTKERFVLNWDAVEGATQYRITCQSCNGFNYTQSGRWVTIRELASGTRYSTRVEALDSNGDFVASTFVSVTTLGLTAPSQVSGSYSIEDDLYRAEWIAEGLIPNVNLTDVVVFLQAGDSIEDLENGNSERVFHQQYDAEDVITLQHGASLGEVAFAHDFAGQQKFVQVCVTHLDSIGSNSSNNGCGRIFATQTLIEAEVTRSYRNGVTLHWERVPGAVRYEMKCLGCNRGNKEVLDSGNPRGIWGTLANLPTGYQISVEIIAYDVDGNQIGTSEFVRAKTLGLAPVTGVTISADGELTIPAAEFGSRVYVRRGSSHSELNTAGIWVGQRHFSNFEGLNGNVQKLDLSELIAPGAVYEVCVQHKDATGILSSLTQGSCTRIQ